MITKNKIKRGTILLMGFMTQNAISFSQSLLPGINPEYNYQQASHFADNSVQPLEVVKEQNKTTLVWNIPNPYDNGVIAFCDKEDKIITTRELNGKQTGKMDIYGNAEKMGFYCYKLIIDDWEIGEDNNLITPVEKGSVKVTEALSSK